MSSSTSTSKSSVVKVNRSWLPLKYGELILDYLFDSENLQEVIGTYPVKNLGSSPVEKVLRRLSNNFTRESVYVTDVEIVLIDEDVTFENASAIYLPFGKGRMFADSGTGDREYTFDYRDLIVTKNLRNSVTFTAPIDAYYVLSFSASLKLEDLPVELLTIIQNKIPGKDLANFATSSKWMSTIPQGRNEKFIRDCGIYDRTWEEWLKAGGFPRVECYYHFLDQIKSKVYPEDEGSDVYTYLDPVREIDRIEVDIDFVSKDASYFVYQSLVNAAKEGYLNVVKEFYGYDFDYLAFRYIKAYENTFEDLPVNSIALFRQLAYAASRRKHYDVLLYLLENVPENAFVGMDNLYKYTILDSTPEIIDHLLEKRYVQRSEAFSWKVTYDAIESGNIPVLRYMLKNGVNPNLNEHSMLDAIFSRNIDMVNYVYDELSRTSETPVRVNWDDMQAAVRSGVPEIIDFAISTYEGFLSDLNLPFLYKETINYAGSKYILSIMSNEDLIRGLNYLVDTNPKETSEIALRRLKEYIESDAWQSLSREERLKSIDSVLNGYNFKFYKYREEIRDYLEGVRQQIENSV